MHKSSYLNMQRFVSRYLVDTLPLSIADIGSQCLDENTAYASYRSLFAAPCWRYTGVDIVAGNNVDITLKNVYHWKEIPSNSFDVVVSGQAFEHIEFFWVSMLEIARILKPGGLCCLIVPSAGMLHRYPLDCWRSYEDGLSALARYADLDVKEVFTQRTRFDFREYDAVWHDSVLICKKSSRRAWHAAKTALKRAVARWHVQSLPDSPPTGRCYVNTQLDVFLNENQQGDPRHYEQILGITDYTYAAYFDLRAMHGKEGIAYVRFSPAKCPALFVLDTAEAIYEDGSSAPLHYLKSNADDRIDNSFVFRQAEPEICFSLEEVCLERLDAIHIAGKIDL